MQINPDTVNPFIWTQSPVSRLVLNCFYYREMYQLIGSLSNNDGDGNEDWKKAIGLISKTATFHVHHDFLHISLPSLHDYNVKPPQFAFCRGRRAQENNFLFLLKLWYSLLTNYTRWNKRDEVWGNTNSLFKWLFRRRRCRCCLSLLIPQRNVPSL